MPPLIQFLIERVQIDVRQQRRLLADSPSHWRSISTALLCAAPPLVATPRVLKPVPAAE